MLTFNDFLNEKRNDKSQELGLTAGVAIVWNNKILIVHPTGSSWKKGSCGIPKGKLEPGEEPIDCALRELEEETGIRLDSAQLDSEQHRVNIHDRRNKVISYLMYFVCNIISLSEIGLASERVPKSQLQLKEVDWGKFVTAEEAYPLMNRNQLIVLDRHVNLNK